MAFFDRYPYTNWHNVNLDWVLQAVKSWGTMVEQNNQAFIDLRAANESFKTYVTTYLQALDVSDEINDKLDDMLASGILSPYFAPYIKSDVENWLLENITPTSPAVDSSLTINGAAANAKTVGDLFTKSLITGRNYDYGTSADDIYNSGIYFSSTTGEYPTGTITGLPYSAAGWLVVVRVAQSTDIILQLYFPYYPTIDRVPKRRYHTLNGSWSAWVNYVDVSVSKGELASGTDLNSVTGPGVYYINGSTSVTYYNSPLPSGSAGTLEVYTADTGVITQRVTRYSNNDQYTRSSLPTGLFTNRKWSLFTSVVLATGDETDMTSVIQTALNNTGHCTLGPGTFYVKNITMPANSMIKGVGPRTILRLLSGEGSVIKPSNGCTIANIKFSGGAATPGNLFDLNTELEARHAIDITFVHGSGNTISVPITVYGCTFVYFSGDAIHLDNTGGTTQGAFMMSDCYIFECGCGMNMVYNAEYNKFENVITRRCRIACNNGGGNNAFNNCTFHGVIGFQIIGTGGVLYNDGHGSCTGCTFNHINNVNNTTMLGGGPAIKIHDSIGGFLFDGCQFWYGHIDISNTVGVSICNSQIGDKKQTCHIDWVGPYPLFLIGCTFQQAPTITTGADIKIDGCYISNTGVAVTVPQS